jgi:hypothetical protein
MKKRISLTLLVVVVSLLLLAIPALAGGAATVVLDELPRTVHAEEELQLGFAVWQHGIHLVDAFSGVGEVKPVLIAKHQTSGETFQAEGYKAEGAEVGHFVVDVTFPSAGVWAWRIEPRPFMLMNEFAPLTVEPALATVEPASTATPMNTLVRLRPVLRWGGIGLALLGIVLAILRRPRLTTRRTLVNPGRLS